MKKVTFVLDSEEEAFYTVGMVGRKATYRYLPPTEGLPGYRVFVKDIPESTLNEVVNELDLERHVTPVEVTYTKRATGEYKCQR